MRIKSITINGVPIACLEAPEIDIENAFRDWVSEQGGITYKWEGSRKKLDLIVVSHTGYVGLLEMKRPGGAVRPQQARLVKEVSRIAPGVAVILDNIEQCKSWYVALSYGMYTREEGLRAKEAEND